MLKRLSYDRSLDRPSPSTLAERAEMQRLLDEFLQNGGVVTQVPPGTSAIKVLAPCKVRGDGYLNGSY